MPEILIFVNMLSKLSNYNFQNSYNSIVGKIKEQIMKVTNDINSNNTAFSARFRVKPQNIDHVMSAIDEKCDIKGLRRIYNSLKSGETGLGSDEVVFIEPVLKRGKKEIPSECGFMKAKIGEAEYSNDVVPTFSFGSLPHYFEKLQRLSQEKFLDSWTNLGNRTDELLAQSNRIFGRMIGEPKGSTIPCYRRDCLLDGIHYILTKD